MNPTPSSFFKQVIFSGSRFWLTALCWKSPWGIVTAQLLLFMSSGTWMLLPHSQARTFPSVPTVLLAQYYGQLQMEAHPALLVPQPSTPEHVKKICQGSLHAHRLVISCRSHSQVATQGSQISRPQCGYHLPTFQVKISKIQNFHSFHDIGNSIQKTFFCSFSD